jgi:methionyl-tRNA formyltransferase
MKAICDSGEFDVQCLITNPLRFDKSNRPIMTPAREFAAEYGIPVCEKQEFKSQEFYDFIYLMRPDLLFVCDFGHILSRLALRGALLGGINLHGSLLPRYRGAAPVSWAVVNGDPFTGVSIIHMEPAVDAGPVIAQSQPIAINPRENVLELEGRLARLGASLVLETVRKMSSGDPVRIIEQIHSQSTKAPKLTKEDGRVNWKLSSQGIYNWFRATVEWPRLFTIWHKPNGQETRLILGEVVPLSDDFVELIPVTDAVSLDFIPPVPVDAKIDNLNMINAAKKNKNHAAEKKYSTKNNNKTATPTKPQQIQHNPPTQRPDWWHSGVVVKASGNDLIVAAAEGVVKILQVQPAGKRMMSANEFLSGYRIEVGENFV